MNINLKTLFNVFSRNVLESLEDMLKDRLQYQGCAWSLRCSYLSVPRSEFVASAYTPFLTWKRETLSMANQSCGTGFRKYFLTISHEGAREYRIVLCGLLAMESREICSAWQNFCSCNTSVLEQIAVELSMSFYSTSRAHEHRMRWFRS